MFALLMNSYINTSGNWKNGIFLKTLVAFLQFLVFPISTCVDIAAYQQEKCFVFRKYYNKKDHIKGHYQPVHDHKMDLSSRQCQACQ